MRAGVNRRIAAAVLALGIAGGGLSLTTAAFASTTVKVGAPCTKAQLHKTTKVGKTTLVCEKVGNKYKWEKK